MAYSEEDYIMLSALQHVQFCPRQCYLIHAEQIWQENSSTAAGRVMHERVDRRGTEFARPGVRLARALPLRCEALGLVGRADLVEFDDNAGTIHPVEYKLGQPKENDCDLIQLCAQGMSLEEMLGRPVDTGAVYYGKIRRRLKVELTAELKQKTREVAAYAHSILGGSAPPAPLLKKSLCKKCSLEERCLPQLRNMPDPASYLEQELFREDGAL